MMKEIEGVSLADLLNEEEQQLKTIQIEAAKKQINGILFNLVQWRKNKQQAENQAQKAQQKIDKSMKKLQEIRSGNWNVLTDDDEKQANKDDADG